MGLQFTELHELICDQDAVCVLSMRCVWEVAGSGAIGGDGYTEYIGFIMDRNGTRTKCYCPLLVGCMASAYASIVDVGLWIKLWMAMLANPSGRGGHHHHNINSVMQKWAHIF